VREDDGQDAEEGGEVMRMGRKREMAASSAASILERPAALRWLANSTMRMPFLVTMPMSMKIPIWLKTLSVWWVK
jgi:hypothetical protein